MKWLSIILFTLSTFYLSAQQVSTIAGVLETPGFNDGNALSARFFNPHGIALDEAGNAYIADRYNHTIRRLSVDGQVTTLAGKAGFSGAEDGIGEEARFNEPWGICAAADGTVYVADTKNNKIRQVSTDGRVTTFAGTGNFGTSDGVGIRATFGNPTGIEVDEFGNLYIAEHLTHTIRKIDTKGVVSTIAGIPYIPGEEDGQGREAQFFRPYGLTLDNQGNILVADEWNHKIRRVTPEGVVTTVAGIGEVDLINGTAQEAAFNFPWDLTVDEFDNIYVVDGYNYVIRKITPEGMVTNFAGIPLTSGGVDGPSDKATFSGATSIVYNELAGTLYVGDAYNHLVRMITTGRPIVLNLTNVTGKDELCEGEELLVRGIPATAANYAFYVDSVLVQNSPAATCNLDFLEAGSHQIQVASFDNDNLIESNILTVEVEKGATPEISVIGESTFYEGDSTILVANGVGSYRWSNGETTQTITVKESGAYSVVLEPSNGACGGRSEDVVVQVLRDAAAPVITVEGSTIICPGISTLLRSDYVEGNQWLKDGWLMEESTDNFLEVTEAGFYQVQIIDPVTGVFIFSEEVEIQSTATELSIDFRANNTQPAAQEAITFEIIGAPPKQFSWDFGTSRLTSSSAPAPTIQYESAGAYSVSLIIENEVGCQDTIRKENYIRVASDTDLFIPTGFTPNNDGVNDLFRVRGRELPNYQLQIFNQWGEQLHASQVQEEGWNGSTNGQPVNCGTYTYVVAWNGGKEGVQYLSGHVTLLR